MQTDANLSNAEHGVASARRQLHLAQLKISQLLGMDVLTAEAGLTASAPPNADFEKLTAADPDYLLSKHQLESAEIAKWATMSEFLPDIALSASYRDSDYNWPPNPNNGSTSVVLNFSYNFFPGGSNLVDSVINSIRLDKAQQDFQNAAITARYNIEAAFEQLQDAMEGLKVQQIFLTAAEEQEKISTEKYVNGLMTYTDWDLIETSYISAQESFLSAENQALAAEASWFNSYGGWVK